MLAPRPGETYVDCTAGLGGHAAAIAPRLAPGGRVVLNDADPGNLERAAASVAKAAAVEVVAIVGNFANLPRELEARGLAADMVLADLGFASTQMDDPSRGFSFSRDGPLDMRMDPTLTTSAADLVNGLSEPELARIIDEFGEDRDARRIARKIVQERASGPISTTARLAEVVRSACAPPRRGAGPGVIDPATRTFQALRIAVNDELGSLDALLSAVARGARALAAGGTGSWLRRGARIAFISFHSLEDRPIKQAFRELVAGGAAIDLAGGALAASDEEAARNPRSRSGKLRAVRVRGV